MHRTLCRPGAAGKKESPPQLKKSGIWDPHGLAWKPRDCLLGFALVVLGAALLFSHLRASPRSPDEQAYLAWALSFALEGKIAEPDGRNISKSVPPLHTLMVGVAFKSLGVETEVAQAVSVIGGALCVGVCFLLGYLMLGLGGGVLASLLMITSGKGEIWEYSNRVLNDIHLTLWVSCVLLCAVAYVKRGSAWTALGMGLFLGLGTLTKESMLLTLPILCAAFLLGEKSRKTRFLQFLIAIAVAGSLTAPLLFQRYKAYGPGAEKGAPRQGLRAGNLSALVDSRSWGFRGLGELGNNLLLRGMPSGAFRVIYGVSLLACLLLAWRRRAPKELLLPLFLILVWVGVFQTFVHLPLTRRQLLPLFPAHNLIAAFVLIKGRDFLISRFFQDRIRPKTNFIAGSTAVLGLALLNMPPQTWPQVTIGKLLQSPSQGFLEKEAREALSCASDAALFASNFDRALYFFLKGKVPVLHLQVSREKESIGTLNSKKGKKQTRSGKAGWASRDAIEDSFSLPERFKSASPMYAVIFCPGLMACQPLVPSYGGPWVTVCEAKGVLVLSRGAERTAP